MIRNYCCICNKETYRIILSTYQITCCKEVDLYICDKCDFHYASTDSLTSEFWTTVRRLHREDAHSQVNIT